MQKIFICIIQILLVLPLLSLSTFAVPEQIFDCGADLCSLLSIPRYKMYMSMNDTNTVWLMFANNRYDNFIKTTDGGLHWNATEPDALTVRERLGDHSSISGDSLDNIYVADRRDSTTVYFRKVFAPAQTAADFGPEQFISVPSPGPATQTPNIIASDPNNVFIILRASDATDSQQAIDGNIWYVHSSNGGTSFSAPSRIIQSNTSDGRIGSFLIQGKAAVVWHIMSVPSGSNVDYQYFIWNGSSFIRNPDGNIVTGEAIGDFRGFSMNYANDQLHLVYNARNTSSNRYELRYKWKNYNNGVGSWSGGIIETSTNALDFGGWDPSLTAYRNELYLFYTRQTSDSLETTDVYYRKWNATTNTWGPAIALMIDGTNNENAQGPLIANPNANYIPVVWTHNQYIYYDRIVVNSSGLGPCEDGICNAGDVCPELNGSCTDTSCYEPTCALGCGLSAVAFGLKDEACLGSNYCNGVGSCTPCRTDLELDCNGRIDGTELNDLIQRWYADTVSINKLMEGIKFWKAGIIN